MTMKGPTPLEHPSQTNQVMQQEAERKERLARQQSLALNIPKSIAIVGCGGVGSWLAYMLALAGAPTLYLFDPDVVSPTNLNRLPITPEWVGKSKSDALKAIIHTLRPTCDVYALLEWSPLIADSMRVSYNWLACSTDTLGSRQAAHKWCQAHGVNYIEAAAEGEVGSASGSPAEWASPLEKDPGYASVPVWIGPCVTAAYLAATHILHDHKLGDAQHRLSYAAKEGVKLHTYK